MESFVLYYYNFSDDELDLLFKNIELGEPDLNHNSIPHVRLFVTVESPTCELVDRASLALTEGGNGVWRPEGGSGQRSSLSPILSMQ